MQFEVPMKGNFSGYICNHGSLNRERDTASPRLCAMLRTQASDEEVNDVSSRRPLYCSRAGSDVMGCRRPTSGVFILYASDTSHAEGVPHSDLYIYLYFDIYIYIYIFQTSIQHL